MLAVEGGELRRRRPGDGAGGDLATMPLGMAITALTINPSLRPNLPYDTKKDLLGVSQVAQAHFGLFAHPSAPFNTMPEPIAYAKENPDKLSYATPGAGTGTTWPARCWPHGGIKMVHVPYKGSAPAQQDVIGGRVPLLLCPAIHCGVAWLPGQPGMTGEGGVSAPGNSPSASPRTPPAPP